MTSSSTTTTSTTYTTGSSAAPCGAPCPLLALTGCASVPVGGRCEPDILVDRCVDYTVSLTLSCPWSNLNKFSPPTPPSEDLYPSVKCQVCSVGALSADEDPREGFYKGRFNFGPNIMDEKTREVFVQPEYTAVSTTTTTTATTTWNSLCAMTGCCKEQKDQWCGLQPTGEPNPDCACVRSLAEDGSAADPPDRFCNSTSCANKCLWCKSNAWTCEDEVESFLCPGASYNISCSDDIYGARCNHHFWGACWRSHCEGQCGCLATTTTTTTTDPKISWIPDSYITETFIFEYRVYLVDGNLRKLGEPAAVVPKGGHLLDPGCCNDLAYEAEVAVEIPRGGLKFMVVPVSSNGVELTVGLTTAPIDDDGSAGGGELRKTPRKDFSVVLTFVEPVQRGAGTLRVKLFGGGATDVRASLHCSTEIEVFAKYAIVPIRSELGIGQRHTLVVEDGCFTDAVGRPIQPLRGMDWGDFVTGSSFDNEPPTLLGHPLLHPARGGVAKDFQEFTLYFSEAVRRGWAPVRVLRRMHRDSEEVDVLDAEVVFDAAVPGKVVVRPRPLALSSAGGGGAVPRLPGGAEYELVFNAGAFQDMAGNHAASSAELLGRPGYRVRASPWAQPSGAAFEASPERGAQSNVSRYSNIALEFSDFVAYGGGHAELCAAWTHDNVCSSRYIIPPERILFLGRKVLMHTPSRLAELQYYNVSIPYGLVLGFEGLRASGRGAWSFGFRAGGADELPPELVAVLPDCNGDSDLEDVCDVGASRFRERFAEDLTGAGGPLPHTTRFRLYFTEKVIVAKGMSAKLEEVTDKGAVLVDGDVPMDANTWADDCGVVLRPAMLPGKVYRLSVAPGTFTDLASPPNAHEGLELDFYTPFAPPTVIVSAPAGGSIGPVASSSATIEGVAEGSSIKLAFVGGSPTPGSRARDMSVEIRELDAMGGVIAVDRISVDDPDRVIFGGAEVVIVPEREMRAGRAYHVHVPASAIRCYDLPIDVVLRLRVLDRTAPVVAFGYPQGLMTKVHANAQPPYLVFSEEVTRVDGKFVFIREDGAVRYRFPVHAASRSCAEASAGLPCMTMDARSRKLTLFPRGVAQAEDGGHATDSPWAEAGHVYDIEIEAGAYTDAVSTGALLANSLPASKFSFEVMEDGDGPVMVSSMPPEGAEGVDPSMASATLVFDEDVEVLAQYVSVEMWRGTGRPPRLAMQPGATAVSMEGPVAVLAFEAPVFPGEGAFGFFRGSVAEPLLEVNVSDAVFVGRYVLLAPGEEFLREAPEFYIKSFGGDVVRSLEGVPMPEALDTSALPRGGATFRAEADVRMQLVHAEPIDRFACAPAALGNVELFFNEEIANVSEDMNGHNVSLFDCGDALSPEPDDESCEAVKRGEKPLWSFRLEGGVGADITVEVDPTHRFKAVINTGRFPAGRPGSKDSPLAPGRRYMLVVDAGVFEDDLQSHTHMVNVTGEVRGSNTDDNDTNETQNDTNDTQNDTNDTHTAGDRSVLRTVWRAVGSPEIRLPFTTCEAQVDLAQRNVLRVYAPFGSSAGAKKFRVTVPADAMFDMLGNAAENHSTVTFSHDSEAPHLDPGGSYPRGGGGLYAGENLVLTFSKPVQAGDGFFEFWDVEGFPPSPLDDLENTTENGSGNFTDNMTEDLTDNLTNITDNDTDGLAESGLRPSRRLKFVVDIRDIVEASRPDRTGGSYIFENKVLIPPRLLCARAPPGEPDVGSCAGLLPGTVYFMTTSQAGVVKDLVGNPLPKINDQWLPGSSVNDAPGHTWRFETHHASPPDPPRVVFVGGEEVQRLGDMAHVTGYVYFNAKVKPLDSDIVTAELLDCGTSLDCGKEMSLDDTGMAPMNFSDLRFEDAGLMRFEFHAPFVTRRYRLSVFEEALAVAAATTRTRTTTSGAGDNDSNGTNGTNGTDAETAAAPAATFLRTFLVGPAPGRAPRVVGVEPPADDRVPADRGVALFFDQDATLESGLVWLCLNDDAQADGDPPCDPALLRSGAPVVVRSHDIHLRRRRAELRFPEPLAFGQRINVVVPHGAVKDAVGGRPSEMLSAGNYSFVVEDGDLEPPRVLHLDSGQLFTQGLVSLMFSEAVRAVNTNVSVLHSDPIEGFDALVPLEERVTGADGLLQLHRRFAFAIFLGNEVRLSMSWTPGATYSLSGATSVFSDVSGNVAEASVLEFSIPPTAAHPVVFLASALPASAAQPPLFGAHDALYLDFDKVVHVGNGRIVLRSAHDGAMLGEATVSEVALVTQPRLAGGPLRSSAALAPFRGLVRPGGRYVVDVETSAFLDSAGSRVIADESTAGATCFLPEDYGCQIAAASAEWRLAAYAPLPGAWDVHRLMFERADGEIVGVGPHVPCGPTDNSAAPGAEHDAVHPFQAHSQGRFWRGLLGDNATMGQRLSIGFRCPAAESVVAVHLQQGHGALESGRIEVQLRSADGAWTPVCGAWELDGNGLPTTWRSASKEGLAGDLICRLPLAGALLRDSTPPRPRLLSTPGGGMLSSAAFHAASGLELRYSEDIQVSADPYLKVRLLPSTGGWSCSGPGRGCEEGETCNRPCEYVAAQESRVIDDASLEVSGFAVTMRALPELEPGRGYRLSVDAGKFVDASGLPSPAFNGGATEEGGFAFRAAPEVLDHQPPAVVSLRPVAGERMVSSSVLVQITFDEEVCAGEGALLFVPTGEGVVLRAVTRECYFPSPSVMLCKPPGDLLRRTTYRLVLEGAAVTDLAGNAAMLQSAFTTAAIDQVAPRLLQDIDVEAAGAAPGALVPRGFVASMRFSEPVHRGSGQVLLFDCSPGDPLACRGAGGGHEPPDLEVERIDIVAHASRVNVLGASAVVELGALEPGRSYALRASGPGVFIDRSGHPLAILRSGFEFSVGAPDVAAPELLFAYPEQGHPTREVSPGNNITLYFSEPVQVLGPEIILLDGPAPSCVDGVRNTCPTSALRELRIPTDGSAPRIGSVTVRGAVVSIDPAEDFSFGSVVALRIPEGTFADRAGNLFRHPDMDVGFGGLLEFRTPKAAFEVVLGYDPLPQRRFWPREGATLAWLKHGLVIIGGKAGSACQTDTWRSTSRGASWEQVQGVASTTFGKIAPAPTFAASAVDASECLWLLGGECSEDGGSLWRSCDAGQRWGAFENPIVVPFGIEVPTAFPQKWVGHAMAFVGGWQLVIVDAAEGSSGAVWRFVAPDASRLQRCAVGPLPFGQRSRPGLLASSDGALWLLGGRRGQEALGDVWASYDIGETWTCKTAAYLTSPINSRAPGMPLNTSFAILPDDTMLILGGTSPDGLSGDVYSSVPGVRGQPLDPPAPWAVSPSPPMGDGRELRVVPRDSVFRVAFGEAVQLGHGQVAVELLDCSRWLGDLEAEPEWCGPPRGPEQVRRERGAAVPAVVTVDGQVVTIAPKPGALKLGHRYRLEVPAGAVEDLWGNALVGPIGRDYEVLTDADVQAPVVRMAFPEPGAFAVPPWTAIVLEADEELLPGLGALELVAPVGTLVRLQAAEAAAIGPRAVFVLPPGARLTEGQTYNVSARYGVVTDVADSRNGNEAIKLGSFTVLSGSQPSFNYTVRLPSAEVLALNITNWAPAGADVDGDGDWSGGVPALLATLPVRGATDVPVEAGVGVRFNFTGPVFFNTSSDLKVDFSAEGVGLIGQITVNSSVIDRVEHLVAFPDENVVEIRVPLAPFSTAPVLMPGGLITVTVPKGVLLDPLERHVEEVAAVFRCLGGAGDNAAVQVVMQSPPQNAKDVPGDRRLVTAHFTKDVEVVPGGTFRFRRQGGRIRDDVLIPATSASVVTQGPVLSLTLPEGALSVSGAYEVQIPAGTIRDPVRKATNGRTEGGGNAFAGATLRFSSLGDTTPPQLNMSDIFPRNEDKPSFLLPESVGLVLPFDEPVHVRAGEVRLTPTYDSPEVRVDVAGGGVWAYSSMVFVAFPAGSLRPGESYEVSLSAGLVQDAQGNVWPGLDGSYRFSTAPRVAFRHRLTGQWAQPGSPGPRANAAVALDNEGTVFLIGGQNGAVGSANTSNTSALNDVWRWSPMRETSCASAFGALEPCTETQCVPDGAGGVNLGATTDRRSVLRQRSLGGASCTDPRGVPRSRFLQAIVNRTETCPCPLCTTPPGPGPHDGAPLPTWMKNPTYYKEYTLVTAANGARPLLCADGRGASGDFVCTVYDRYFGKWATPYPNCDEPLGCSTPPDVGFLPGFAQFVQPPIGSSARSCTSVTPSAPLKHGTSCGIKCAAGLKANSSFECRVGRFLPVECALQGCGSNYIPYGRLDCNKVVNPVTGSRCAVICEKGFTSVVTETNCSTTSDEPESPPALVPFPKCIPSPCGKFAYDEGAQIDYSSPNLVLRDTATATCLPGYEPLDGGAMKLKCGVKAQPIGVGNAEWQVELTGKRAGLLCRPVGKEVRRVVVLDGTLTADVQLSAGDTWSLLCAGTRWRKLAESLAVSVSVALTTISIATLSNASSLAKAPTFTAEDVRETVLSACNSLLQQAGQRRLATEHEIRYSVRIPDDSTALGLREAMVSPAKLETFALAFASVLRQTAGVGVSNVRAAPPVVGVLFFTGEETTTTDMLATTTTGNLWVFGEVVAAATTASPSASGASSVDASFLERPEILGPILAGAALLCCGGGALVVCLRRKRRKLSRVEPSGDDDGDEDEDDPKPRFVPIRDVEEPAEESPAQLSQALEVLQEPAPSPDDTYDEMVVLKKSLK